MRPREVTESLAAMIGLQQPAMLWGGPGTAKSSLVHASALRAGKQMIDIRAVLLDPVDLRGIPKVNGDGMAHWCPPGFLPRDGEGVLFLDELPQAPPMVQAACLQLMLDRRIGEYVLPEGWCVLAAGNRQGDRAGAQRLISPLLNRLVHIEVEVSVEDWKAWAVDAEIAPEVRSFIDFKSDLLYAFRPESTEYAFPTPRSWHFVSNIVKVVTKETLLHDLLAGTVGKGAAAEFMAFLRVWKNLPDMDTILAAPQKAVVPREPDVLCAVIGSLVERVRDDKKQTDNAVQYIGRMPLEFSVVGLRDVVGVNPQALALPSVRDWTRQNGDLFRD